MKKKLLLFITIVISLTSCNLKSKSGNFKKQTKTDAVITETNVDSLQKIISDLISGDYDREVKALKQMPEYEHAIFLTNLETKAYLQKFSKWKDVFDLNTQYLECNEKKYVPFDDTTIIKTENSYDLKIVFDTTQSTTPIASFQNIGRSYVKYKNTNYSVVETQDYITTAKFYYLKNLGIMYVISASGDGESFFDNTEIFDYSISTLK